MKPKTEDGRNLVSRFYLLQNEEILKELDDNRRNFSVLVYNLGNNFNIGTIVRNANAFLAKEVILYGKKKYNRKGAVGTYKYTHFRYIKEGSNFDYLKGEFDYVIGVDNVVGSNEIENFCWPSGNILMCFGNEYYGLPDEFKSICDNLVHITQFGSVRSLNVGVASGIAMFHYCLNM